eukprot:FR738032.1.p1 GENE.FR738032.1~~FR738032.1.p1  ORF type:complete len:197 (+),score=32.07 FR738032.1:80-670(+)
MRCIATLALVLVGVSAFAPVSSGRSTASVSLGAKSKALPFLECPEKLDGSMVGDLGFDPMRISDTLVDLNYARAAEIKHGRVCMLAITGMLVQEKVHLPMFSGMSYKPLDAVKELGLGPNMQIFITLAIFEFVNIDKTYVDDSDPGNLDVGSSFLKGKSDAQIRKLKEQEMSHCRLAMLAFTGAVVQTLIFDTPLW